MQTNLPPTSHSPSQSATDTVQSRADSSASELLAPAQRNFAQVLGRLLALQWEREQELSSHCDNQA
jgi:hypothetical protein